VPGLSHITALASAHQTAYALRADGTLASWGLDGSNELGTGDPTFTSTSTPATVPGLSHVVAVGAGSMDAYIVATG
jgi:alpha-tubulin suppressor-like RCC1 family protein